MHPGGAAEVAKLNRDFKITREWLKSLDLAIDRTYSDSAIPGFRLRVRDGRAVYQFRYGTGKRGEYEWVTIGAPGQHWRRDPRTGAPQTLTPDVARVEASVLRGQADAWALDGYPPGKDPRSLRAAAAAAVRRPRSGTTFEQLAEALLARHEMAERTRANARSVLRTFAYERIGARDPATLKSRDDLRPLLKGPDDKFHSRANEVVKWLKWVFARACEEELLEADPAAVLTRPLKARRRRRVLTPDEIRAVWWAALWEGLYGRAVRLAFATACREEEIFGAPRKEFDRRNEVWRIPDTRTKNELPKDVPILPMTAAELDACAPDTESPWLLPAEDTQQPIWPTSKAWKRLLQRAGIIPAPPPGPRTGGRKAKKPRRERRPWTAHPIRFHDIRRTIRNTMTHELGVPLHVAEAVLGHAQPVIVDTYAPSGVALRDRRAALEAWERRLREIADAKPMG